VSVEAIQPARVDLTRCGFCGRPRQPRPTGTTPACSRPGCQLRSQRVRDPKTGQGAALCRYCGGPRVRLESRFPACSKKECQKAAALDREPFRTMPIRVLPTDMVERARAYLLARVDFAEGGHWLWAGYINNSQSAIANFSHFRVTARQLVWMAYRGAVPSGNNVVSDCSEKGCIHPDHIRLGNQPRPAPVLNVEADWREEEDEAANSVGADPWAGWESDDQGNYWRALNGHRVEARLDGREAWRVFVDGAQHGLRFNAAEVMARAQRVLSESNQQAA